MTGQPVQANVVLTADTSNYDSNINQSAAQTDQLGKSVDALSSKIDRLTKSAGHKLVGFAAGDLASITAATAVYGAFENQMTSLSSQAAVLSRSMEQQKTTFNSYVTSVNNLRSTFGTSTREAADLVESVTRFSDSTADVDKLSASFIKLGKATGESPLALQQGMAQLQRAMGTTQRDTDRYNNQLVTLSKNSNASAGSILNFATQLAPVGRLVNMSQTDIMGISTAFQKSGQDGMQAANVFSKMMSDVAYASQSGSPDLAKYANLVGMTVGQFKNMGGTDQFVKIFDAINRQGPQAITTLNRMGLDGMRTVRTVTSMAQQSGGLQEALNQAHNADPNALNKGSGATDDLLSQLAKLRSQLTMTGEAFGKNFAGPASVFLKTLTSIAGVVRDVVETFSPLISKVMMVAAPLAAIAAAGLLAAKGLMAFSLANQAVRNSLTYGYMENRTPEAKFAQSLGGHAPLGRVGRQIETSGNFVNRGLYSAGRGIAESGINVKKIAGAPLVLGMKGAGLAAEHFIAPQYSGGTVAGLENPVSRWRMSNKASLTDYAPIRAAMRMTRAWQANPTLMPMAAASPMLTSMPTQAGFMSTLATASMRIVPPVSAVNPFVRTAPTPPTPFGTPAAIVPPTTPPKVTPKTPAPAAAASPAQQAARMNLNQAAGEAQRAAANRAAMASAASLSAAAKGGITFGSALKDLNSGMMALGRTVASVSVGFAKTAYSLVGSNPYLAAAAGGALGYMAYKSYSGQVGTFSTPNNSGSLNPYLQAGGLQPAAAFNPTQMADQSNRTVNQANNVSSTDVLAASDSGYKLNNPSIKGKTPAEALTMLQPQYRSMKNNAKSLTALSLDLTSLYGAGTAQRMLNTLAQGGGFNPAALISAGMNEKAGGGWLHRLSGDEDATAVSQDFGNLFGAYRDQTNYTAQTKGVQAAAKQKYNQFGQAIQDVNKQAGAGFNPTSFITTPGKGQSWYNPGNYFGQNPLNDPLHTAGSLLLGKGPGIQDSNKTERIAFMEGLFKTIGVKLSDKSAESLRTDPTAKTEAQSTRGVLQSLFGNKALEKDQNAVLSHYGLNLDMTGAQATRAVMAAMQGATLDPGGKTTAQRIAGIDALGGAFGTSAVKNALNKPEDTNAQLNAVNKTLDRLQAKGMDAAGITQLMGRTKAITGDASDPNYILASQVQQQAQRYQNYQMPSLSRPAQFQQQLQMAGAQIAGAKGDPNGALIKQGAEDTIAQQVESQREYFVGLLTQQREFDISKKRSQADFDLQRTRSDFEFNLSRKRSSADFWQQEKWSQADFARSRARSEFDFALQRDRSTADFNRSLSRGYADYTLSRRRAEQDFQHQVTLMVKQSAMESANIYKRTMVQPTTSGNWLVFNAGQQLKQLQEQEKNLQKLRKAGMSDDAIQQLKLTDPNNAQQLQRLVGDVADDPKLVAQFNDAVGKRLKAAKALVTDKSSASWQEMVRQYRISADRGKSDFDRQVDRSKEDFRRNMDQQESDFQRMLKRGWTDYQLQQDHSEELFGKSMDRQQKDYNRSTNNMVDDFNKSMRRAAADLSRSAETIDGNLMDILNKGVRKLSGHAKTQAQAVLNEFKGLKNSTNPVAIDLMTSLSKIFGIEYHAPKLPHSPETTGSVQRDKNQHLTAGQQFASGGVLPGFTPGVDVHHYYSPTGGSLHLSGGEAIMRPEWTRAVGGPVAVAQMNDAAKKGQSFASGGTFQNPDGRVNWGGMSISRIAAAQLKLAEKISGLPMQMMQGGFGGSHIAASGTSHNYPGVADMGPGSIAMEKALRQVGFAAWARNVAGRSNVGSGAHVHAISLIDPGDANSPQVTGSWPNHGNGLSGYNNDPAPHYAWLPNLLGRLGAMNLTALGGGGGMTIDDILKPIYQKVEKAANMANIHPLAYGQMSARLNKMARAAYTRMVGKYGNPNFGTPGMGGQSIPAGLIGHDEKVGHSILDAESAGRGMAQDMGWTGSNWNSLFKLWTKESNWRWNATNPSSGAYGIPQALPASKLASAGPDWRTNPGTQIKWGLEYIKSRYGTPDAAWRHEMSHNWYGDGGVFNSPQKIGIGERGPEMVLPLNDKGADFITNIMQRMTAGNEAKLSRTNGYAQPATVHNQHNYQIDRSTTFSGPISVQANDANALIKQLQARARASALTNAARGGVKV